MEVLQTIPENKAIVQASPIELAQSFLKSGGDIASLEKMMDLQERFDKNEAKKAYTIAMAAFKANPPKIDKDKSVSFKQTKYNHASLGNVTEKINKSLAEHGLTAAWTPNQDQDGITITCTITHKMGYSESASLTAGADNSGAKNNIQALGSTISYLQRYTILSLTGLATHDQDDDGVKSETVKCLSEKQCIEIREIIESIDGLTEVAFLKMAGCETVEEIHAVNFDKAKIALKQRAKAAK